MTKRTNILQELEALGSPLATASAENPYAVPAGYFDTLAEQVLQRIQANNATTAREELLHLSALLSNAPKTMPYHVPNGYFDSLQSNLHLVYNNGLNADEELKQLSPLLGGLREEMPYQVPTGYFDNVHVPQKKQAKFFSLANRPVLRYAAAAVVIGLISFVAIFQMNKTSNSDIAYKRFEKKLDKEIEKTSDQELAEFVQYTDAANDLAFNQPKVEVKEMLKDVPATELEKFLDEVADPEISPEEPIMME